MSSFITDIKKTVKIFKDMRKASKEGYETEIRQERQIPVYSSIGFLNTVEGCVLINHEKDIYKQVNEIFKQFSLEEQEMLVNSPKDGEFIERINFWKYKLQRVMDDRQCRKAMLSIIHWYIHIKKLRF